MVANFFALRELELATMFDESVSFDHAEKLVHIKLPISKTDPMTLGCARTWVCTCLEDRSYRGLCPYHAACSQSALLRNTFADLVDKPGFPFSPSSSGHLMIKQATVTAIRRVHRQIAGAAAGDGDDPWGHVFRVSGLRHMVRNGVSVPVIMLLARWGSNTVLKYLRDAPLRTLTSDYRRGRGFAKAAAQEIDTKAANKKICDSALKQIKNLEVTAKRHDEELQRLAEAIGDEDDDTNIEQPERTLSPTSSRSGTGPWIGLASLLRAGRRHAVGRMALQSSIVHD